jgi:hypothetical protein
MIAAHDAGRVGQRRDRAHVTFHASVVERAVVVALVRDGYLDREPAFAGGVD